LKLRKEFAAAPFVSFLTLWLVPCIGKSSAQSPSLPQLVTVGSDHQARGWDASGKQILNFLAHDGSVNAVVIAGDGKIITAGDDKAVKIWNADGQLENTLDPGHDKAVLCLSLSSNGKLLATGASDGKIRIWNYMTGKLIHTISAHTAAVRSMAWNSDGSLLATGGADRLIQIWRSDGKPAGTIIGNDEPVTALGWAGDGRTLVSGAADGLLQAWSSGDFGERGRAKAHLKGVNAISFASDGS